ncbi:MAG: RlmE family RNA methyltransferase [Thermodesulfobacteriota bacterium]
MRKVKDYYYKKAKKDKYPARSVYKLEEALNKYKFIRRGDSVLDLGCSPGSWSLYASEVVGEKGLVVGADLTHVNKSPRAGGAEIIWLKQDIMEPEFLLQLRKIRPTFKVLISDIAPRTTGNRWADHQHSMRLVRQTLVIATEILQTRGNYYCKAFQGEEFPGFVQEMKEHFEMVKTIKPKSSRVESREVFVLGMNFRGRK